MSDDSKLHAPVPVPRELMREALERKEIPVGLSPPAHRWGNRKEFLSKEGF
jgi:hypothetical protein